MQEGEGLIREEEAAETLVRPIHHRPIRKRALRQTGGPRIDPWVSFCGSMVQEGRQEAVIEAIGALYD
jgi:hypothetical protein